MPANTGRARHTLTVLVSVTAFALASAMVFALPRFVGVSWTAITTSLASVDPVTLTCLLALWFAGLVVHVPVLKAAMPGLKARQALTLNLAGSAVSAVLPFGGPAGMGLGYAMARSWGFGPDRFASYTVATNLWNALGKFAISILILATAALIGPTLPPGVGPMVIAASIFAVLAAGGVALTFRTARSAAFVGCRLDALGRHLRLTGAADRCAAWLVRTRVELGAAIRTGWRQMSAGVVAYLFLQGALLLACLAAVGAHPGWQVVAIAFAVERLISLVPFTPGATGLAEIGTVAALNAFGVNPVAAAAGVLLFRLLLFALEMPVGGALALGWLVRTTRAARLGGDLQGTCPAPIPTPPAGRVPGEERAGTIETSRTFPAHVGHAKRPRRLETGPVSR